MLLVTSVHTIAPNGEPDQDVVAVVSGLSDEIYVGIFSNRSMPNWFTDAFDGSQVQFESIPGRADGTALRQIAQKKGIPRHKVIVLAGNRDDIAMAKNGGAVLVGAGWSSCAEVARTGLAVGAPLEFARLTRLINGWAEEHWHRSIGKNYSVEALCDISTIYKSDHQARFGKAVRDAIKGGEPALNGLLALASCLLIHGGIGDQDNLMWGIYPSSASSNDDNEVLSDFGHRLRTTVSRVRMARRGQPLFLRHRPTIKRSANSSSSRKDPTSEVESIHLNPVYRRQVSGRNIVVIDDCTTYGISMATAAGFLRRAGASSVTGLALGKFGDCLDYHEIKIDADPFAPVGPGSWSWSRSGWDEVEEIFGAQAALRQLLGA